ncbi:MAG: OadG family protein [Spirochaetaceae bacterium]|jgi:oxaloacetate decarboxylase gamma subunit|nr:OadG family protein [Spirochaetaceae bacterium]
MTIGEMFEQSAILTVLGMAVVFAFLWIMIICMSALARVVNKMGWDKDIRPSKKDPPKNTGGTASPEVTAAISAAVTEYREKRDAI